jgi:hypothetical protein
MRKQINYVSLDDNDLIKELENAKHIIDSFSMYFYTNDDLIEKCEKNINYVIETLYTGTWVKPFLNSNAFLPEKVKIVLDNYLINPKEYLLTYFQFEDDNFDIVDNINVFPPEIFLRGNICEIDSK